MNSIAFPNTLLNADILTVLLKYSKSQLNEPFYIYFSEKIREKCRLFNSLPYRNKAIHFASMANSNPDFLKIIHEEKLKIFVNSKLHLELAINTGFKGHDIIFTASAMDESTMVLINKNNVSVNLDSIQQLNKWCSLFPFAKVGIRCNIGDSVKPKQSRGGYFIGKESRLGLSIKEIESLKGNTQINGLHLYAGTDIIDISYFIDCYKVIIELSKNFPSLDYIDVGGGFGIKEENNEEFDFVTYGNLVNKLMSNFSKELHRDIKLILEPGRIIGAEAGFFVCRVIDIKERNGKQFIGVNASSVQFPRPLLYPEDAWHPIHLISDERETQKQNLKNSSIYGCSTYSRDFFAKDISLPEAKINDIIIIGNAGSYCASSHLKFLGYPQAKEIFV